AAEGVLRPELPQLWIEGYDLMQDRAAWVPYETVTLDFVQPADHRTTFLPSTNGLASGNHLLEAIVHGLCEVIERDATALWYRSQDVRKLDLTTVDDAHCVRPLEWLAGAGVQAAVWNLTADTAIPVYGCTILEPPHQSSGRSLGVYYGFGCHLSPGVA